MLKRFNRSVQFSVLFLAASAAICFGQAGQDSDEAKAKLRAAGMRVEAKAFFPADPPKENAYADVVEALALFRAAKIAPAPPTLPAGGNIPPDDVATLEKDLKAAEAILAKLDAVDRNAPIVWPADVFTVAWQRKSAADFQRSSYELGLLLANLALLDHQQSHDLDAIRDLRRLLILERANSQSPFLPNQSLAQSQRHLVSDAVIRILPKLDLIPMETIQEAKLLLHTLQDDASAQSGLAFALEASMAMQLQERATPVSQVESWPAVLAATRAPNWPKAKALLAKIPVPAAGTQPHDVYIPTAASIERDVKDFVKDSMLALAHSRAASLLLAAQIHEQVQMGPSQTIADLIDENLPRLPVDPFSETDQPLHFRLEPAGVVIWSVGEDGKDDGGKIGSKTDLVYTANAPAQ